MSTDVTENGGEFLLETIERIAASNAEAILPYADILGRHGVKLPDGVVPPLLVPSGCEKMCFEEFSTRPLHREEQMKTSDIESFIEFVNRHKTKDMILLTSGQQAKVVFDYHKSDVPSFCNFSAYYAPKYSAEFDAWKGIFSPSRTGTLRQREFVDFLEENVMHVLEPDPGAVVDMVRKFRSAEKLSFASSVNNDDGTATLTFEKENATPENLRFQTRWKIEIPIFENDDEATVIDLRVRHSVNGTDLSFVVSPQRLTKLLQEKYKANKALIVAGVGMPAIEVTGFHV